MRMHANASCARQTGRMEGGGQPPIIPSQRTSPRRPRRGRHNNNNSPARGPRMKRVAPHHPTTPRAARKRRAASPGGTSAKPPKCPHAARPRGPRTPAPGSQGDRPSRVELCPKWDCVLPRERAPPHPAALLGTPQPPNNPPYPRDGRTAVASRREAQHPKRTPRRCPQ